MQPFGGKAGFGESVNLGEVVYVLTQKDLVGDGLTAGAPEFESMWQGYHQLGSNGLVWRPGENQARAFERIKHALESRMESTNWTTDASGCRSILAQTFHLHEHSSAEEIFFLQQQLILPLRVL